MSLKTLTLIVSSLGVLGGGAYAVHSHFSTTETIRQQLEKENREIVDTNEGIRELIKNNKDSDSGNTTIDGFTFKNIESAEDSEIQAVKTECQRLLSEKKNSENKTKAKKWCTKEKNS